MRPQFIFAVKSYKDVTKIKAMYYGKIMLSPLQHSEQKMT